MEKALFIFIYCHLPALLYGQVQTGLVREINSGKKPIGGVQVTFDGAVPTISDDNGIFRLAFSGKKPGDFIFLNEIRKEGYELVNGKDLEVIKISNTGKLGEDIIVAKKGVIDAAKKEYYEISDKIILANFEKQKNFLIDKLSMEQIKQNEYELELTVLQKKYYVQQKNIEALSEELARINFDDLDSLHKNALDLFKDGHIDSVINLLESADLIKKFKLIREDEKNIKKAKYENIRIIQSLASFYTLSSKPENGDSVFKQILYSDSSNIAILAEYAEYNKQLHNYKTAVALFSKIAKDPNSETWRAANAYSSIGNILSETGDLLNAKNAYVAFNELYQKLLDLNPNICMYKSNLANSFDKLGLIFFQLGDLKNAMVEFEKAYLLNKELCNSYPRSATYLNGFAITCEHLAIIHSFWGNYEKALILYKQYNTLEEKALQECADNITIKESIALSYQHLGDTYLTMGYSTKADSCYIKFNTKSKELSEKYPNVLEFQDMLAVSYIKLGISYGINGNHQKSLNLFEISCQIEKKIVGTSPLNINFRQNLAISFENLGTAHLILTNFDTALLLFKQFNEIELQLFNEFQQKVEFKHGLAISFRSLGDINIRIKNYGNAKIFLSKGMKISQELIDTYQDNIIYKTTLISICAIYGRAYYLSGKLDSALLIYKKQLKNSNEIYLLSTNKVTYSKNIILIYQLISGIHFELKQFQQCFEYIKEAIEISSTHFSDFNDFQANTKEHANVMGNASFFALFASKFAEAEQFALTGLATDSSETWIYTNLALAYLYQGKWEQAKEIYVRLKDQPNGKEPFKVAFLQDLKDLEAAGITHPDVSRARALLESPPGKQAPQ